MDTSAEMLGCLAPAFVPGLEVAADEVDVLPRHRLDYRLRIVPPASSISWSLKDLARRLLPSSLARELDNRGNGGRPLPKRRQSKIAEAAEAAARRYQQYKERVAGPQASSDEQLKMLKRDADRAKLGLHKGGKDA
jgi:hypothetical protein